MPSYQSFNPESKFILKELLNKNRVLTMSNNRKCDYLIVDVGKNSTTMMAINNQVNSKDILVIKTFVGKPFSELVDEAYWLCNEFGIHIILADKSGMGLGFIEQFEMNINPNNVSIRALDERKIYQNININEIINDLNNGVLRFLQSPELAKTTYIKPFLGLSNIIEYHKETSKLIDEINNIEIKINLNSTMQLYRIDETIGKSRVNCLLAFYSYPMSGVVVENKEELDVSFKEKYDVTKRIAQYEVIHGTFYKYLFKCIENDGIKVLFYHNGKHKIKQFQNITQEDDFRKLFQNDLKSLSITKDGLDIVFFNGSYIRFVFGGQNSCGHRYHYAVVDSDLEKDIYYRVILPASVLFERDKDSMGLKDNYNIETIEM